MHVCYEILLIAVPCRSLPLISNSGHNVIVCDNDNVVMSLYLTGSYLVNA